MKPTLNPALDRDALYGKSQVYIARGLRAQSESDAEEYQLWASLALELLAKAALAKTHPALIADPQHYLSLFAACGHQLSPEVRTIGAATVFQRLGHLDKRFDSRHQKFCEQMALRRNAELHSGESLFSGMSAEKWEAEYWGAIELVLAMQGMNLETWLGAQEAKAPSVIIQQALEALEWAVKNRISRSKEDFERKYPAPKQRAEIVEKSKNVHSWELPNGLNIVTEGHDWIACPSCTSNGVLAGALWNEEISDDDDAEDRWSETVEKTYIAEEFVCPFCCLRLFGSKEIEAAGLPEEFIHTEVRERHFEPEYGND